MKLFIACLGVLLHLQTFLCVLRNPYNILGVSKSASIPEIRRAYKQLVSKWHPDKNKSPEAEERFIEVTQAYELLQDPERRHLFDRTGQTEDTPNFRRRREYTTFSTEEFVRRHNGHAYPFNFDPGSIYLKTRVGEKTFSNRIIPESNFKPFIILFFEDLCLQCLQVEPVWQKIHDDLEPLGVGVISINMRQEPKLAERLVGSSEAPVMAAILGERPILYREDTLSLLSTVEFLRRVLSRDADIPVVKDESAFFDTLSGWHDNRIRAVIFSQWNVPRLRYNVNAYKFRQYAQLVLVPLAHAPEALLKRYNAPPKRETLVLFHEMGAFATLSMPELPPNTLRDVMEENKFLVLPRISSQAMFDELCPPQKAPRKPRRFCVMLVTKNSPTHDLHRAQLRLFILRRDFPRDRVRFMFVHQEKQREFVKDISGAVGSPDDPLLHLVILWRRNDNEAQFQWIGKAYDGDQLQLNNTQEELVMVLERLMHTTEPLPCQAILGKIYDEHAQSLWKRLLRRLVLMGDALGRNVSRYELLPVISVAMSFAFIVAIGYFMAYLVQLEEKNIREKYREQGKEPPGRQAAKPKADCKLNIHELRGETYNGLVRLLKPGCRTVILLVDNESRNKLLPQFFKAVFPYRKNKTLMFAFMMLEKNLEWYRRLLLQTLGENRQLNINPKNCIGTVLSLNGHRKYFCVYHAKYQEQPTVKRRHRGGGEFMGFEDGDSSCDSAGSDIESGRLLSSSNRIRTARNQSRNRTTHPRTENDDDEILFEEHLLDGLSNWLDRLFEGTTKRYYIQYWPECMK